MAITLDPNPAERGSSFYYSTYRLPDKQRTALTALQAFTLQLRKTSEYYKAPEAAQAKLVWWQQEIERLFAGEPSHPITQTLQPYLTSYGFSIAPFLAMLEAAALSLTTQTFQTQAELAQHYQHTGGILTGLQAHVLFGGKLEEPTLQFAHTLGIATETIRHIIDMPAHLSRGHIYLPLKSLQQHDIDLQQFLQHPDKTTLSILLKEQQRFAEQCYQDALQSLPAKSYQTMRPLWLYAALRLKRLQKIARGGFNIFEQKVHLSPLYKLFFVLVKIR